MKEKILLVDDSDDTITMIERKLVDYDVVSVKSGREMWNVIDKINPSLILLDVIMPNEDGFELAKSISSAERYSHIPIVFITAKTDGKDVEVGFNSGGFDYVKKPFDPIELKARIRSAMRKKQQEEDLKSLTYTDYLTGAYNRRFFFDALVKELERLRRNGSSNFAIAMIDIDHFKHVNDSYGHQAGDQVLIEFVKIIKKTIRPYDLLARYGGEEFVLIFFECDKHNAMEIMQRIKSSLEQSTILFSNTQISITFSSGISDLNDTNARDRVAEDIIRIADEKLYSAKQNGRNMIMF